MTKTIGVRPVFLFTIFSFILSSCVQVYFIEPQPKGGILLTEIPEELQGKWTLASSEFIIDKRGYTFYQIGTDTLSNSSDTIYERVNLTDSVRLYKSKRFYIVNSREDDKNWEIVVIKKLRNGDIYLYETRDPEFYIKDRNLKLVSAKYEIDDRDTIVGSLNPYFEGSSRFQSAIFSGQMKLKGIKKIAKKKNIIFILKKDGTLVNPSRDIEENN